MHKKEERGINSMSYSVDTVELKKLMVEKGFDTIGELAEKSGVGRDTVSGVVNGKIRPSTAVMEKLMTTLDMKPVDAGTIFFNPNLRDT